MAPGVKRPGGIDQYATLAPSRSAGSSYASRYGRRGDSDDSSVMRHTDSTVLMQAHARQREDVEAALDKVQAKMQRGSPSKTMTSDDGSTAAGKNLESLETGAPSHFPLGCSDAVAAVIHCQKTRR